MNNKIINKEVEEIKNQLKQHDMTQEELSQLSGVPLSTVNKILAGITPNPRIETIQALKEIINNKSEITNGINDMSILNAMEAIGLTDEKLKKLTPNKLKLLADFINLLLEQG